MEKTELIEPEELACRALFARRWTGSTKETTSAGESEEFEGDNDLDQYNVVIETPPNLIPGFKAAGPIAWEESYVLEVGELFEYYWPFVSSQGLMCIVPEYLMYKVQEGYRVSRSDEAAIGFETPGQLIALPARFPYQIPLSGELAQFCSTHHLLIALQESVQLIKACFPSIRNLELGLEQDPETAEEWLVIEIEVAGEIEEILERYDRYTEAWVKLASWPERDKVRLSYNII